MPCAECVELSLLALNSTETVLSETVMLGSTPDAVMLDDTLANLHSSLVPSETRMNFQRCVVLVTISCCSSVALQLMHQCLYTAPSHVAAVEMPSLPLCDSGCLGSAGGRKCPQIDRVRMVMVEVIVLTVIRGRYGNVAAIDQTYNSWKLCHVTKLFFHTSYLWLSWPSDDRFEQTAQEIDHVLYNDT